jgi:hypothetical protein
MRKLPNSLCLTGRIHSRTYGCKWSLLKVRKGKYKGEHVVAQMESGDWERELLFLWYF